MDSSVEPNETVSVNAAGPPKKHKPTMRPGEIEMLSRHLAAGIIYLEFGAGFSTRLALKRRVGICHSVESDPAWIERLRSDPNIRQAEAAGRLFLHYADAGPVWPGGWGMPMDRSGILRWPNYFLQVWEHLQGDPDVVLIDGRFRTACGLAALLVCPPRTTILMHDFFCECSFRQNYRTLLEVAEIVEQEANLVALRRRPEIPARTLAARMAGVWTDFG